MTAQEIAAALQEIRRKENAPRFVRTYGEMEESRYGEWIRLSDYAHLLGQISGLQLQIQSNEGADTRKDSVRQARDTPCDALSSQPMDRLAELAKNAIKERDVAREALKGLCDWFGLYPAGKHPHEQWERLAEEFYQDTGLLRPGKDYPAGAHLTEKQEEERSLKWRLWAEVRRRIMIEKASKALTFRAEDAT